MLLWHVNRDVPILPWIQIHHTLSTKSGSIDIFTTSGPISLLLCESILEALNEIGDSKDCDKGYDSEEYDAAMKEFEAQLALEGLEKNQVAAIASRPYVQQF
jgi:hypothetical protein